MEEPYVLINPRPVSKGDVVPVSLRRTEAWSTDDLALWTAIRGRCKAIEYGRYEQFIASLLCDEKDAGVDARGEMIEYKQMLDKAVSQAGGTGMLSRISIHAVDSYNVLRLATEIFLLVESGLVLKENGKAKLLDNTDESIVHPGEESERYGRAVTLTEIENMLTRYFGGDNKLPYLRRILMALVGSSRSELEERLPYCGKILQYRLTSPSMIELIWNYWQEEGMLCQVMNVISMRFQNKPTGRFGRDPMAEFEIDPLRPLSSLLWGYIQNEYIRLTPSRRDHEYAHNLGLRLLGKAAQGNKYADFRSKFIGAFHHLLNRISKFYVQDSDTTVVADAFPLLTSLRELHVILSEGAHNQFGDLPWTARVEMLMEQWILARPQMGEFLRGRPMTPYKESWMGRVDSMKKLQGWIDTSITHFNDLATYGEMILLGIRYGDWINVHDQESAKNWARYWKPEIQSYIHAYRAVTGVDLSATVDSAPPWVHLKRQYEARLRGSRG